MIYEELIKDKLEDISFLELKDDASVVVNGEEFFGYLPLPILNERIVDIVKDNVEEIEGEYFVEGMIYILSLDYNNDYSDIYFDFIKAYTKDIKGYVLSKALEFLNDEKTLKGIIYLNALINLDLVDEKVLFALGNGLENVDISDFYDAEKTRHILEIMNIYEKILNINEDFSLAHYKLGYIYKNLGQFVKAKLSFEKFLELDENDFRLQEVREELEKIDSEVKKEEALLEMEKGRYDIALEKLVTVDGKYRDDLYYYNLSVCYINLGELEAAFDAIYSAIDIKDDPVYQNQLAIYFQRAGEDKQAKKVLENAIDKFGEDYYLNFNLGTVLYNEGDTKKAIKSFESAYKIEENPELLEIINELKSQL